MSKKERWIFIIVNAVMMAFIGAARSADAYDHDVLADFLRFVAAPVAGALTLAGMIWFDQRKQRKHRQEPRK